MHLKEMGWAQLALGEVPERERVARITGVHKSHCEAITSKGNIHIYLSGEFRTDKPVTGDFVYIGETFIDEQNSNAAILQEILPRYSKISRMAAGPDAAEQILVANVDYTFIVTSANDDFSLNRLQRFILLAIEGNVTPVVVLSKIDLIEDPSKYITKLRERFAEIEIILVSSVLDVGLEKLKEKLLIGTTSVFLGSSGVGKSTLVNKLLGEQVQATRQIREDDSKGRHATTSRELFFIPSGGMIIDTPGLREVQILASKESVASTFEGIAALMKKCRFSDCTHDTEPGCAVNSALESGELNKDEYNNYLKLQKEAEFAERKISKKKSSNAKERWKKINKNYKARRKFEGRN